MAFVFTAFCILAVTLRWLAPLAKRQTAIKRELKELTSTLATQRSCATLVVHSM